MSIASEIEALASNLASAKNAVIAKGGTISDSGLAGLAGEITTIPTGSADWGTVTYTVSGVSNTVTIQSLDEYLQLAQVNGGNITIGGETFDYYTITGVALGKSAEFAPDNFLRGITDRNFTLTGTENLIVIENNFLYTCNGLNRTLDLSNVVDIGDYFMFTCSAFNSPITFTKLKRIGLHFMDNCTSFAQPLTIPSTTENVDDYFMYECNNFTSLKVDAPTVNSGIKSSNYMLSTRTADAIMYTTGITLTGAEATRWKNRLNDRTSTPYRKLILGES